MLKQFADLNTETKAQLGGVVDKVDESTEEQGGLVDAVPF